MRCYAIMHTPTGKYLPELTRKKRGGYTHTEPTDGLLPRLFRDEAGAKRALTWWLKGVTVAEPSFDMESGFMDGEDWNTQKKPERKRENMVVVPMVLAPVIEVGGAE